MTFRRDLLPLFHSHTLNIQAEDPPETSLPTLQTTSRHKPEYSNTNTPTSLHPHFIHFGPVKHRHLLFHVFETRISLLCTHCHYAPSSSRTTSCPPGAIRGQKDFKLKQGLLEVYKGPSKHTSVFPVQQPAVQDTSASNYTELKNNDHRHVCV